MMAMRCSFCLGAVPGAGCGKAVERAVWNVTLPSTFCMIWWMWPLSTVTELKRFRYESAWAESSVPQPHFRIDRPQRDVSEDDNRRRCGTAFQVVFKPFELIGAEISHAAALEIEDVDEPDEMHAVGVERVPTSALGAASVAIDVKLPIRVEKIVFAGDVMHIKPRLRDDAVGVVELRFQRKMADVAGMNHEGGLFRHGLDPGDGLFEGAEGVRIGRQMETDMATLAVVIHLHARLS